MAKPPPRGDALLPHDKEAEQGMLGAIIQNPAALSQVAGWILPEHFFSPGHRAIYGAMLALHEDQEPIDTITLGHSLKERDELAGAGGLTYIAELVDLTPAAANVRVYAAIVAEMAQARAVIAAAMDLAEGIRAHGKVDGQASRFNSRVEAALADSAMLASQTTRAALDEFMEWVQHGPAEDGLIRTFTALDKSIAYFEDGAVHCIAARPGVGKTTLLGQIAVDNARRSKSPGLFLSLEKIGRAHV